MSAWRHSGKFCNNCTLLSAVALSLYRSAVSSERLRTWILSVFQAGAKLYQGLFQEGSRPLFHEGVPQGCIYFQIHFCNDRSVDTDDRLKGQCACFHWPQALEAYDKGLALDKGNEECKNGKEQARPNWTEEQRSEGASTQAYQHNTKCTGSQHGNEQ